MINININEAVETASRNQMMKDLEESNNKVDNFKYAMTIHELASYGGPCRGFGLNWAGRGTVNIDEIKVHAEGINIAIKLVESLNKKYKGKQLVKEV